MLSPWRFTWTTGMTLDGVIGLLCGLRQNVFARNLHRSSVYTPQLVVDGQFDSLRDPQAVAGALSEHRDGVPVTISVRDAQVRVELGAHPGAPNSDVVLVPYLRHAVSAIGRGENAGRTLEE